MKFHKSESRWPKKNGQSDQKKTSQFTAEHAEIAEKENYNYPLRALRSLR
jgi:hypothetical protein